VFCNKLFFLFSIFITLTVKETIIASPHYPTDAQTEAFAKEIQKLEEESTQKVDELLKNEDFQAFVSELNSNIPGFLRTQPFSQKSDHGDLYIFVSFPMAEKGLLNLAIDAKRYGATLVLRGFIDGSYGQTVKALQKVIQKADQGFIIDPELFTLFNITVVPTFILAKPFQLSALERTQTPLHDRLQGHVSIQYVLEAFAKEGSLTEEAKALLAKSLLEKGELK